MLSTGLHQEVTVRPHMPSPSQIQWACYERWKVECEAQTGVSWWSASTFENSCGCTGLDMLEWTEVTEQIDWRAKQSSQVACFLEDLKCWGAWDTTCGHKTKDITPSIAWRRGLERGSARRSSLKGQEGHCQPHKPQNRFKNSNNGETSERWGGVHNGFFKCIDTILNWTATEHCSVTPCGKWYIIYMYKGGLTRMVFMSPSRKLWSGVRKLLRVEVTNSRSALPIWIWACPHFTRALPAQPHFASQHYKWKWNYNTPTEIQNYTLHPTHSWNQVFSVQFSIITCKQGQYILFLHYTAFPF